MTTLTKTIWFIAILLISANYVIAGGEPKIIVNTNGSPNIQIGDSILIVWNAINTKKLYCEEIGNGKLPLSGSIMVAPLKTTSYIFFAQKGSNSKRKKITITVSPPEFESLKIPENITDEEISSINWSAKNATIVRINGLDDDFGPTGKLPLKSVKDTTITITAINKNGYATSKTQKVNVSYQESLNYPTRVARGNNAQITWDYKNTKSVEIVDMADSLPPYGEINFPITKSSKFRMYIYRENGTYEVRDMFIEVYESKIITFKCVKKVMLGEVATLTWEVKDADSVKISPSTALQPLKGSYRYTPKQTEFVTITAYLNGMEDTRSTKVDLLTREYIKGEKNYSDVSSGKRLDYEIFSTDLSEYPDLVKLYVLVVDTEGNFIHGMAEPTVSKAESKTHFMGLVETYVGGGQETIDDFSVYEISGCNDNPTNISMVLDYSGSMSETVKDLEYAAKSFINNKKDNDNLSVIRFDHRVNIESYQTKSKQEILNKISFKGLDGYGGNTALYAAMGDGLMCLDDSTKSKKEMIVFTDGFENSSMFFIGEKTISAQQVANLAIDNNIKINILSFGSGVNSNLLEVMAAYTGGSYYPIEDNDEIRGVWTELPYLNRNYYMITFRTKDISKINGVQLKYNDNTGQTKIASEKLYMNTPVNFNKFEGDSTSYWLKNSHQFGKYRPVSTPQVISLFEVDGTTVMDQYLPSVDSIVEFMKRDTCLKIVLFGHTDLSDTPEYNLKLSEDRCNTVKKYISEKGIEATRILSIPLGEEYPIWVKEEETWMAKENRRIEVLLLQP